MKLFFYFYLSFLPCLITLTKESYGQSGNIQFEHLTIKQGLSHNYVMYVMQDRKGYLWFGTGNGLDKYDGYQFTNYKFDPRDTTTIPKNQVFMMWEDSQGLIWIGTAEGISRFDPHTEKFTRLERTAANPYAFKYAQSFNEDAAGNIWVGGSFEGELRQIDRKTGKFSPTNYAAMLKSAADSSLKDERLHIMYKDKKGTLWVGSPFGLHRLNISSPVEGRSDKISFTHFRHDPSDSTSISPDGVASIFEDRTGTLWILTHGGILNAFDPKSTKFTRYLPSNNKPMTVFGLLGSGLAEDLEGNLWIGTMNGLYRLDKKRKLLTPFLHNPTDPGSISNNFINSLLVDNAGILWVTTNDGVNKLDPHQKSFILYQHNPLNPQSLSNNKITAICEDKEGLLWVGTMDGGLNALDRKTGIFTHYKHDIKDKSSLRSDTVSAMLESKDGNLWIGNGNVLSVFSSKKKQFTHYFLNHPFQASNGGLSIFTLYEDRQNQLWIGTNNGILSFDRQTGKTNHYPYDPDNPEGISDYWALAILEDSKGNLWIGPGSQALNKLDRKTGKFTHYRHDSRKPGSIASNTIPSIYEDSKGNLWFGTGEGGLCQFNYATQTFTTFTEKDGLSGNAVFSILEDMAGNLWLGTNNGISKFSPPDQTFTNYSDADGLQSKLFAYLYTDGAAFKGKDGTMYFGGNSGLNAFHPASIRTNTFLPSVVITAFKLFDKPLAGKHEAKEIELQYNENFFSIEFAALSYTSPHKNQYAYQLEGVNKGWVQAGTSRTASYTDIAPGKYIFKVKGSNNDGVWNPKPTILHITIHPPFWKTPLAYAFYVLFFIAALLLARREVVRREHLKANLKIQQIESDKLREMDTMKSHFFTNISHEFRTPLSIIQGTIEKLEKEDDTLRRKSDYKLINGNTNRLLQLINQLLDLSALEAGKLSLHTEPEEITGFFTILASSFASLFENKQIRYQYIVPSEAFWVRVDKDKLEKIITNLLFNSFKFTSAQGEVKFMTQIEQKDTTHCQLHITIKDTGIGIDAEQLPRIFDRFHQVDSTATRSYEGTGIGLALVKELVELHGGGIRVESKENIGTSFYIRLPLELTTAQAINPVEGPTQTILNMPAYLSVEKASKQSMYGKSNSNTSIQVLVVEDNAHLRRFIVEHLSLQYKIVEAENGSQGLKQALETIPDIVISDVMMPEMDGITFCEKLKTDERTSHIPFILLTAKADMVSKLMGLETGADDYLTKPFKLEELQLRMHNILESRRKLRERFSRQITVNPKELTVTSSDERFLQKALSIMEANMSNADFDVEVFCKEIGLSRAQLHRKLTALCGQSTNDFIRSLRLKRAASLLKQQQGNISEIAFEVGFSSLNYFTKCFRDFYGQTPTEYIRSNSHTEI